MPTSKLHANMSYREVIPRNLSPPEWIEVKINTGELLATLPVNLSLNLYFAREIGTQSTLQDLKTFETSGGYCYKSRKNVQTRNRFIYW